MAVPFTYTYLIGSLLFMIPWIFIYATRKDLRYEMITVSILGGVVSVITGYWWWTIDWWHPQTVTGTRVGVEDFILGWANGGVGAVLYEAVHKTRTVKLPNINSHHGIYVVIIIFALTAFFYELGGMTTFFASSLALMSAIAWIMQTYPQFNRPILINGIYMVVMSIPVYLICEYISPGWISATWFTDTLSGFAPLTIPIEDLYFYLLAGMVTWPISKLWNKLVPNRY